MINIYIVLSIYHAMFKVHYVDIHKSRHLVSITLWR